MLNLHRGQGMDLYWRDNLEPPSEAKYLQMIANKTGGLFRLILRLLQSASSKFEPEIEPLVNVIGLMFQISDDYQNLKDDKVCFRRPLYLFIRSSSHPNFLLFAPTTGIGVPSPQTHQITLTDPPSQMRAQKGYCEDLTEGKFSFPISHAIWVDDPRKNEILRILSSKTTDDQVKAYVVQCLEEAGSFDYTIQTVQELYMRAKALLDRIPQRNPAMEGLVEKIMSLTRKTKRE